MEMTLVKSLHHNIKISKFLFKAKSPNFFFCEVDSSGRTALHWAVHHNLLGKDLPPPTADDIELPRLISFAKKDLSLLKKFIISAGFRFGFTDRIHNFLALAQVGPYPSFLCQNSRFENL
jgi:hypothetical protein